MEYRFKRRKKNGGGPNWGAGWDDLCKEYWDDLEQISGDNFYGRHNEELINKVFSGMENIMENKVLPRIRRYAEATGKEDPEWTGMAEEVLSYFKEAKTISYKVIAINSAEQFLRAAEPDAKELKEILGEQNV